MQLSTRSEDTEWWRMTFKDSSEPRPIHAHECCYYAKVVLHDNVLVNIFLVVNIHYTESYFVSGSEWLEVVPIQMVLLHCNKKHGQLYITIPHYYIQWWFCLVALFSLAVNIWVIEPCKNWYPNKHCYRQHTEDWQQDFHWYKKQFKQ